MEGLIEKLSRLRRSRRASLRLRLAQHSGDGLDSFLPIRRRNRFGFKAEGAHGVLWRAAVAEEPRTRLTSDTHGLMPLERIDMLGDHWITYE